MLTINVSLSLLGGPKKSKKESMEEDKWKVFLDLFNWCMMTHLMGTWVYDSREHNGCVETDGRYDLRS